jgi:hypothetical protein
MHSASQVLATRRSVLLKSCPAAASVRLCCGTMLVSVMLAHELLRPDQFLP